METTIDNLCDSCTNSKCIFQSGIIRTNCDFYMTPRGEQMTFPNTFDEFAKVYGFKDKDEVYTNGLELIPVFRVNQWLEHILKEEKISKLERQLSNAGDRRDWDECERLEKEIDKLNEEVEK